jgi:hypothetical protein
VAINKICRDCKIELTTNNTAKKNKLYYRNWCKQCDVKKKYKQSCKNIEKRRLYANNYARRVGRVKQYPCETCETLCFRKNSHPFCSDKCRFMSYIEKTDSCWIWKGGKFQVGYSIIIASRYSYEIHKGPIEDGLLICHTCDNPPCVNPEHLWQGTNSENIKDAYKKGRLKSQKGEDCHNAKLTEKDVLDIRELFKNNIKVKDIAPKYNITSNYCRAVCKRTTWKHI